MSAVAMIDLTRTLEARRKRPDWVDWAIGIAVALAWVWIGYTMKGTI